MATRENKEVLKHLDKLHAGLCKEYDEDDATGIINDILKVKLLPYFCINLYMGSYESIELIYKCIKHIKEFKNAITSNIEVIVMSGLNYPGSMKVALDIYEDCNITKFFNKFNEEMLICIYKHALKFPQNKDACMSCIRRHILPNLAANRPFMYLTDEVDIIQPHFNKDKEAKANFYDLVGETDAVNTLYKVIRYYKDSNIGLCKLSLPAFMENLKYIDFEDQMTRIKFYDEVATFSRWEFIPYIFEELRPKDKEWNIFRVGIYHRYSNEVFIRTLFHYMDKYDISIETLKKPDNVPLICCPEVATVFEERGITETFKVSSTVTLLQHLNPGISNLFYAFIDGRYNFVTDCMHISVANYNTRFIRERAYLNSLVINDKLGWNNELRVKWISFMKFTYEVIDQLNILDNCLAKYNSFHSIVSMTDPLISMRFINNLWKDFQTITNVNILKRCEDFGNSIRFYRKAVLKEVREVIDIELDADEEWVLPKNPTLEDYFRYAYQYSDFGKDSYEEGLDILVKLRNNGCIKISEECLIALTNFVPVEDIKNILRIKNVLYI